MLIKQKLAPKARRVHGVTIDDEVWNALIEHCNRHNQYPGEAVEAALRKYLDKDLTEAFG